MFWYQIYYKHTKQHKDELKRIKDGVLLRKKTILEENS